MSFLTPASSGPEHILHKSRAGRRFFYKQNLDLFSYSRVRSFLIEWGDFETTRLPREKELGETPQGVTTTEEACRFPRRKASCFKATPFPYTVTNHPYFKFKSPI